MVEIQDLKTISVFKDLNGEELGKIKNFMFEKTMRKGMTLFYEGMSGGVMYLVKNGEIEIFKRQMPEDIILAKLSSGTFVGEMSLIDDEPRSASARITKDTVLLVITKAGFNDMIRRNPECGNKILMAFLRILSGRLRDTNKRLVSDS